jgi:GH43 family beta-xylosidase
LVRLSSRLLASLTLLTTTTAAFAAAPPEYKNPLVLQRADPHVQRHGDGQYYMAATVPTYDRIEIRRSETIQGLGGGEVKTIWHKHDKGPMSHHIWAPELHRIGDTWYVYFAAGRAEAIWDIRIWVLSNDSADPFRGEWVERGQLKTDWESFALDATTFEHRGTRYLLWAQADPKRERGTGVYIAPMKDQLTLGGKQVLLTWPELPWERIGHNVNEGPAIIKRNGRIFMTYSASATDYNYCLGMLTAAEDADLLDPKSWQKSPTPVMTTDAAAEVYGPGHNSFTVAEDGTTDLMIYHARDYRDVKPDPLKDPNRHTRVLVVEWDKDGRPTFPLLPGERAAK